MLLAEILMNVLPIKYSVHYTILNYYRTTTNISSLQITNCHRIWRRTICTYLDNSLYYHYACNEIIASSSINRYD